MVMEVAGRVAEGGTVALDSVVVNAAAGDAAAGDATPRGEGIGQKLNWLRAGVLGANDGVVSVAGVVIGVAAATPGNIMAIATAGIAALVAGAFSMAGGEYVSVSTQRDTERVLGFASEELTSPWIAALSSFVAFTLGGLLPLAMILLPLGDARVGAAVAAVIGGLFLTGWISAHLGSAPKVPAILRNVLMGSATMAATYLIGLLFGVAVS